MDKYDSRLTELVNQYWTDFIVWKDKKIRLSEIEVETNLIPIDSIPLIWHGDMDKYLNSNLKVITVSLNPHYDAFEVHKTKSQFNDYTKIKDLSCLDILSNESINDLKQIYNDYFSTYKRWNDDSLFKVYEQLLNIVGSSYSNEAYKNSCLHLDMYSALATNPIWTKLSSVDKQLPQQIQNVELFKQLLEFLNPDLILVSVAKDKVEKDLLNNDYIKVKTFIKKDNKNEYSILYKSNIRNKPLHVLWGRYYNKPFGYAKSDEFAEIIRYLEEYKREMLWD